jgi:hypothetical protein
MSKKACSVCQKVKAVELFHVNRGLAGGRAKKCKSCVNTERTTIIKCITCNTEKMAERFYLNPKATSRMNVCKSCYGDPPMRKRYALTALHNTDPVDYPRIKRHLDDDLSEKNERQIVELWNATTDYILPRKSGKNKPLKLIGAK